MRRVSRSRYAMLITAAACLPLCAATCAPPTSAPLPGDERTEVFLLRGLWDIFSVGLDSLAGELQRCGIAAVSLSGPDWQRLADSIEKTHAGQSRRSPLMFVGHSYGADDAINLAYALREKGIHVELLILIDSTDPAPIPSNVDRCVHYYIPNALGQAAPDLFSGNPVAAESGNSHTQIVNRVVSEEEFGPRIRGVDHFNIESSAVIHEAIVDEVQAVLDGSAEAGSAESDSD